MRCMADKRSAVESGYRRIAALLRNAGWYVNDKRPSQRRFACLPGRDRAAMAT